jgi:hypothetical protein
MAGGEAGPATALGPAALAGGLAGLVGVTLVRVLGYDNLMPVDWLLGAWLGATTFALAAAVRRLDWLTAENARLRG